MESILNEIFDKFRLSFVNFLPQLIMGLILLLLGYIIAKIINKFLYLIFNFFKIDEIFTKIHLIDKKQILILENIIFELIKWIVFLTFFMTALEIWGLTKAVIFVNQLISFIPNVIIAIIVIFVGLITSNFINKLIIQSTQKTKERNTLIIVNRLLIFFFTFLIVLNQLGVAKELITIIFAGIVLMFAIAGGLAFGLGGKEMATEILNYLKKRINHS